ncbi:MAG TPA: MerR family transcriptional regulator [Streptosporangiaceae bacterium]|nr:MerR family transcriptional regulator [Streptosporangiaceae bacterium]
MSAQSARAYFSISEVLAQLRGDYPDVSVSKIRFLESEGLIEPARSPSGYRRFGPGDIERLRYILSAQRDQYLPLRVIKEKLGAIDRGEDPSPRAALGLVGAVPPYGPQTPLAGGLQGGRPPGSALSGSSLLSRSELADAAGIGDDELGELEEFGLVRRSGRHYGPEALIVARTAAELARFGVQPRHLRAVKAAAERETALIDQVVAPTLRQRSPGARDRAEETAREIAALTLRLHAAFLEAGLRTDLSQ